MIQNLHSIQPQPRATVPAVTEAAPIYYGILTDQGQALLAAAIASGTPLPLTAMAAGDGGGQPVTPLAEMTELVNEVHRAPLNQLFVDPTAPNQIVAEMVMAETIGGFWIRELGLFAESGELFAVCNTPDSYKPVLAEGAGRSLLTRMILIVSDTAAVELIINPDTVMASRAYVDAKLAEHAASRDHPAAIEGAQGMIPLATQAMVDEGTDHTSAVTPQTASITFARLQHEHEIDDVLWLQEALDEKAEADHTHTPTEIGAAPAGYGLGEVTGRTLSDKSCNEAVEAGWYSVYSGTTDTPQGQGPSGARMMVTTWNSDSHVSQLFFGFESNQIWVRSSLYDDATQAMTWKPWTEIYTHEAPPTAAAVGAMPTSGGAFDAGAKVNFTGSFNGPDDVALDMGNQSIGGVHGITFSDSSGSPDEALLWPRTGITGTDPDVGDYDSFRVIDGVVYINANKMYHQGFEQPHTIGTPTELGANVDLDTIKTPGVYCQTANAEASTALHYPEANAGSLVVYQAAGPVQQYFVYNSSRVYVRAQYSTGGWTAWAKQYNTQNKPTAADAEAATQNCNFATKLGINRTISGANAPTMTGVWQAQDSTWAPEGYGTVFVTSNEADETLTPGSGVWIHYLFIGHTSSQVHTATNINGSWSGWKSYAPRAHTHTAAQGNADIVAGSYGQVGTCGLMKCNNNDVHISAGGTVSGSYLRYSTAEGQNDGGTPAGTWKCLGYTQGRGDNASWDVTLFIRIA